MFIVESFFRTHIEFSIFMYRNLKQWLTLLLLWKMKESVPFDSISLETGKLVLGEKM